MIPCGGWVPRSETIDFNDNVDLDKKRRCVELSGFSDCNKILDARLSSLEKFSTVYGILKSAGLSVI